jgi:hypothetical protein
MGLQMHGWVEIRIPDYTQRWEAAINVDHLAIGRMNEIFMQVFGIMPSGARVEDDLHPLAAARGVPSDASPEVREWDPEVNSYAGYPDTGHTWIHWSELEHIPWGQGMRPSGEPVPDRWRTLFELMALLGKEYGADQVRLVAWFA